MTKLRLAFMGTPVFAVTSLAALAEAGHEIACVYSQPPKPAGRGHREQPSPVHRFAAERGWLVRTPKSLRDAAEQEAFAALELDVAVVVAYGLILPRPILQAPRLGCVNVHASLLPRWRGAAPIQRALMAGDQETGVCLQIMVRKLDAGPILGSRKIPLTEDMNAIDLYERCKVLGADLIAVDLMDYLRGNLSPTPQDESQVTYAPKISKEEAEIHWEWDAERIHNLVRGLALGPFAYTQRAGRTLKIHRTRVHHGRQVGAIPGAAVVTPEKSLL